MKSPVLLLVLILAFAGCKEHHDDHHEEVSGFKLIRNNTVIAQQTGTVVTGSITLSRSGTNLPITVIFQDDDGHDITEMESESTLLVESSATGVFTAQMVSGQWQFNLTPVATGSANIVVNIMHSGHKDFESRPVPVTVGS
jgi:hypothetical protein